MSQRHHIIIPCGTSQIEPEKIRLLEVSDAQECLNFFNDVQGSNLGPQTFYSKHQRMAHEILTKLIEKSDELVDRPMTDSVFGGEISTLQKLKSHLGWEAWSPAQDTYVILSSDTGPGYFCAQILRSLLTHPRFLNIPEGQLGDSPCIVQRLRDNAPSQEAAEEALYNFVTSVQANMVPLKPNMKERNVLLMTGGYKSIIPGLTLFSVFYGLELVYLFEKSAYVQSLFPDIAFSGEEWKQWQIAVQNLLKKTPQKDYLRLILEKSPEQPMPRF